MNVDVVFPQAARRLQRCRRPLFVEEVEALIPGWMAKRRAVQRRGRRAYREWLRERRSENRVEVLWFTDDEVGAAVRRLCRRKVAVHTVDVMQELAPAGKPRERLSGEIPRVSYQLVRLHRQGRLERLRDEDGAPLWAPSR